MTPLSKRRTKLTFETNNEVRYRGKYRSVIVEAQPEMALLRLRGTRTAFPVSWEALYHLAAKLEAVRVREAKKKAGGR